MPLHIPGLLPGVEAVRLGVCGPNEFEQNGSRILKGARGSSQVVVRPLDGWEFRFSISENCYRPVKVMQAKRAFSVSLEASTEDDMRAIDAIKRLSCLVNIAETTPQPAAEAVTS